MRQYVPSGVAMAALSIVAACGQESPKQERSTSVRETLPPDLEDRLIEAMQESETGWKDSDEEAALGALLIASKLDAIIERLDRVESLLNERPAPGRDVPLQQNTR